MKLTPSQQLILDVMIYPETFQNIKEETGLHEGALRDDLAQLVDLGYIDVREPEAPNLHPRFYDLDHLHDFAFQATRDGLRALKMAVVRTKT
ncbi:MAG: hypothetical protein WD115_06165 [Balneolaceae bacterium]